MRLKNAVGLKNKDNNMKVYDCFPFFNELDTLEIRLAELYDYVDAFVLVESNKTHSGLDKPLYFQDNKQRFEKYLNKIVHVITNDTPKSPLRKDLDMNWSRENHQRNCLLRGLQKLNVKNHDLILTTDLDEIVRASKIEEIKQATNGDKVVKLIMKGHQYYYNCYSHSTWNAGRAVNYNTLKKIQPSPIRYHGGDVEVKDAGWHFSYMGGKERVKQKLQSFAHQEFNDPCFLDDNFIDKLSNDSQWFFKNQPIDINPCGHSQPFWFFIEVNEHSDLPKYLIQNKEKFNIKDVYFSNYTYDLGSLNHLIQLSQQCKDLNGEFLDVGSGEGFVTIKLARNLKDKTIKAIDLWENEIVYNRFCTNYSAFVDNITPIRDNFLNYIDSMEQIAFVHLDADLSEEFVSSAIDKILPKLNGILCGYRYSEVKDYLKLPSLEVSGELWFYRK